MSKVNNGSQAQRVINAVAMGAQVEESLVVEAKDFLAMKMRDALIWAHNAGNKKCISETEALGCGVPNQCYMEWHVFLLRLKRAISDYVVKKHDIRSTDKELVALRGAIYPIWMEVLKKGEESTVHKYMFIREADVDSLIGYTEQFMTVGELGTQIAIVSDNAFFCKVESLLGCRFTNNGVLTTEQRSIVLQYESALNTIARCNTLLADEGEESLRVVLTATEKNLADKKALIAALPEGFNNDLTAVVKSGIADDEVKVEELNKKIKTAEASLKNATESRDNLRDAYEAICNNIVTA